jgi:hypothetical protein
MNVRKLLHMGSKSRGEINKVKEKYEEVKADDVRVERLQKRVNKIIDENNLAPTIMKALGAQQ